MSSKRGLYKPAVQKEVVVKEKRRTLAQGRLVTKSSANDNQSKGTTKGRVLAQGKENKEKAAEISYTASLSQSARQNLSSLLKSESSFTSVNPRRITPHISEHASPGKSGPSMSLDLSDTESDSVHRKLGGQVVTTPSEILFVDASSDLHGANSSEIDIRMQYVHSPAKVTCHSPAKLHGNLRDTGDIHRAAKIPIDQIPSVSIVGGPDNLKERQQGEAAHGREQPANSHKYKSPMVVREAAVVGNPVDNRSPKVAKMLFSSSQQPPEDETMYHPDPGLPTSSALPPMALAASLQHSLSESSLENCDRLSDVSERSETAGGPAKRGPPPPKSRSAALSTSDIKKKKKATRVVQSRFMASAAKKGPMKATDRSIVTKSSTSSTIHKRPDTTMRTRKPSTPSKKKPAHNTTQPSFSTTPEIKGQGGKVSTPTADGSMFVAPGGVDISAIGPHSKQFHHLDSTPLSESSEARFESSISHGHGSTSSVRHRAATRGHHGNSARDAMGADTSDSMGKKPKAAPRMTQKRLDLLYARYVQWVFLESKAHKAFQDQEKQVMSQLNALWEETEKLRQRDHELDLQLARMRHLNLLDDTLETQVTGLTPVVSSLPTLTDQYSLLAQALDTTRHQMPAKGIHIPAEQDEFAHSLLHALSESEQLLGEIASLVAPEEARVGAFSQTIQHMETALCGELRELSKCKELLAAAQSLTTQESSLQIQEIQQQS